MSAVWNYSHVFHDLYSAIASAIMLAKLNGSSTFSLRLISITRLFLSFDFFNVCRLVFKLFKYFKNIFVLFCMGFSSRISIFKWNVLFSDWVLQFWNYYCSITQWITSRGNFISIIEIMLGRTSSEIGLNYRRYFAQVFCYFFCALECVISCIQLL